jgi:hypothetical protein
MTSPSRTTNIFNSMNVSFPLKQGNANAVGLRQSQTIGHEVPEVGDPYPSVHVPDDILPKLNLRGPP